MMGKSLLIIFAIAIVIRLLYFPGDINFAYDQARDAFISLRLLSGDLVTVGPPSTFEGLRHGALIYYIMAPLYALGQGNPEFVSLVFRMINASGVFILFAIAKDVFNKRTGFVAALIYALSFEQSQIALFLGHPALVNIAILIILSGLTKLTVKKNVRGIYAIAAGLALALQFHISTLIYLLFIPIVFILLRNRPHTLNRRVTLFGGLAFITISSTYILSEFKFGFGNTHAIISYLGVDKVSHPITPLLVFLRYVKHNFINLHSVAVVVAILIILAFISLLKTKYRNGVGVLLLIFAMACVGYLSEDPSLPRYTFAMGASVSLILLMSFLIQKLNNIFIVICLAAIFISNIDLVKTHNPSGTIPEVNAQAYYLLSDEKNILDIIYTDSSGDFSISALTIPYRVNTTWSYLFEWYGKTKYGYVPVWAGERAEGFEGNLSVETARSKLVYPLYLIIEPKRGIPDRLVAEYFAEEDLFSAVVWERQVGEFMLQKRVSK